MRKVLFVIFILFVTSCNVGRDNLTTREETAKPPRYFSYQLPTNNSIKSFRKGGYITDAANSLTDRRGVNLWDNLFAPKKAVYNFNAGEEVIVYAKVGDYLYLSPRNDTSIGGYILNGWVEYSGENKKGKDTAPIAHTTFKKIKDRGSIKQVNSHLNSSKENRGTGSKETPLPASSYRVSNEAPLNKGELSVDADPLSGY